MLGNVLSNYTKKNRRKWKILFWGSCTFVRSSKWNSARGGALECKDRILNFSLFYLSVNEGTTYSTLYLSINGRMSAAKWLCNGLHHFHFLVSTNEKSHSFFFSSKETDTRLRLVRFISVPQMPSKRQIQHPSEVIHCPFSCQKGVALWGWVLKTICMLFSILFTGKKKKKQRN